MSFGIWELGIILAIVALLFGTKKLKTIGGDLGGAIKGFRNAMKEDDTESLKQPTEQADSRVIEGEIDNNSETDKAGR